MPEEYVVMVDHGHKGVPPYHTEFLCSICFNPYQRPMGERNVYSSAAREDAFVFKTLAAAEIAAVFVGGWVDSANAVGPGHE